MAFDKMLKNCNATEIHSKNFSANDKKLKYCDVTEIHSKNDSAREKILMAKKKKTEIHEKMLRQKKT